MTSVACAEHSRGSGGAELPHRELHNAFYSSLAESLCAECTVTVFLEHATASMVLKHTPLHTALITRFEPPLSVENYKELKEYVGFPSLKYIPLIGEGVDAVDRLAYTLMIACSGIAVQGKTGECAFLTKKY